MCDTGVATSTNVSNMANNDDLWVLGGAENKKYVIVFHHFKELGASRLTRELWVVALEARGDTASPMELDCTLSCT
jgi:hypothetical protein